jgi:hypothetical protein
MHIPRANRGQGYAFPALVQAAIHILVGKYISLKQTRVRDMRFFANRQQYYFIPECIDSILFEEAHIPRANIGQRLEQRGVRDIIYI